ncbi:outer membrane beta-barrel protein [Pedobacter sp. Du54]|uniref:type IX secretion/gliding motility protein PorT/SprT n=1 Tax=Pedobacter anseongensis TaxID=3133439 RepID=UPI0030B51BDF
MKTKLSLFFVVFLIGIGFAKAQNWAGGIDDDKFNWGYSFQYVSAEYKIWKNPTWKVPRLDDNFNPITETLSSISSKPTPGFAIGFVANQKITNNLDLRSTPSLVFSERNITYSYYPTLAPTAVEKKVQATMIDLPLSLKLKSDRLKNFRGYMLGGIKYSIDVASRKKNNNADVLNEIDKKINNQNMFFSYEAGAGMDFYFGFFKMSTELKVSHSFKDILVHENTIYASPIEKAKLRHFTFSLFFE